VGVLGAESGRVGKKQGFASKHKGLVGGLEHEFYFSI